MDQPATVTVIDLAPADLRGALLRKSFSRSPNQALYWSAGRSVPAAILTGGLLPAAVLLRRLWRYASHQRFRGGELLDWLRGGDVLTPPGDRPADLRRVRPTGLLVAAGIAWAAGAVLVAWLALRAAASAVGWATPLPADPRHAPAAMAAVAALSASSVLQVVAILSLRLKVERFVARLERAAPALAPVRADPTMPAWTLWPMLLAIPWAALWLAGHRWAAAWLMPAVVALLASEAQRGYITVTDRRLRYALARRIGFLLYGGGRGGR